MNKFKVGDRVKVIGGVSKEHCECSNNICWIGKMDLGFGTIKGVLDNQTVTLKEGDSGRFGWKFCSDCWLIKVGKDAKSKPVKFLLQYERDEDSIEEFQTLPEAKKRIEELTKGSEVKQDSFVIYEIKKVYNVEITKQVNLKVSK